MKVLVTGSSSCLARALLPRLCAREDIEQVTGLDRGRVWYSHPKFLPLRMDIRHPYLQQRIAGHDALVHLAFVVLRGHMSESEMFDINVTGSHKLFHAATGAGIRRLVHLSSAAVYGSGVHLAETARFAPLPGFLYARHKALLEEMLAIEFPQCVRLRPHVILGPNAQPVLKRLLRQPFYPRLDEPHPRLQCVHEDDVADAILRALDAGSGAYNLAVEDNFCFRDVIRQRQRVSVPLAPRTARAALEIVWKFTGWGGEPAWVDGLTQTLLINCRRAITELGWRSRHNAASAIAQS